MSGLTWLERFDTAKETMRAALRAEDSFDMVLRDILAADRRATLFFIDGFIQDQIMVKILDTVMALKPPDLSRLMTAKEFSAKLVTYVEVSTETDLRQIVTAVLSGMAALLVEGIDSVILIDSRSFPARNVGEPDSDRVLRGAHDGFVETLIFNTAMIRRRIRDERLTMERFAVGENSRTDVVLCYMRGVADPSLLERLRRQIAAIRVPAITMGQESLMECLIHRQWFNPFPKVRYTERPDSAAAAVLEGQILLLVDTSPAVMVLPCSLFSFLQDTNDFYFPPLVGSYLRILRMIISFATLFLTPVWYYITMHPPTGKALSFLVIHHETALPVIGQLLIIEVVVDALKIASLNTPNALSNAFGVIGAMILGQFAVDAGLFVPEVLLYMAFVAVSNFTQPSFELGYALKLFRMAFLILTAIWGWVGLAIGIAGMLVMLFTTVPVGQTGYLYPLIPFNRRALSRLLVRHHIEKHR